MGDLTYAASAEADSATIIRAHAELDRMGVPPGETLDGRIRTLHARIREALASLDDGHWLLSRLGGRDDR